ncbi:serine/threonine-protein kinase [Tautonia plasticadhaerens]|uniref:non-specific serine/threonine protein kinase n=1 Tax=Tautonia plasticadhaerens TaxID=2527974 RepID=A0A518H5L1_9BACT|nr:serine/threonine-protein kinase [Tautonia plasticadhaerens]QDV36120.1 Serine/threonine-protein kinase PknB [Tautonia plasticadhaerens]
MAIDPRTSRFWQETLRGGLLDEAALRNCWEAIPEEKREAEAIDRRMARQAISAGYLTLWQAQQALAGRASALRIGKYVALDIIGRGGMGLVFLAKDTRLRRRVAIKVLSRERMSSPRALARFEREAKVGAQLQHDNLVRIYDEGEAKDLRYLVMEYIEGRNVGQILGEVGRLPPSLAASIVRQVAMGLEHARHKGLIHRDVNPQNILVTFDGVAKLADLGLAIDLGDPDDVVTRDGATVGTFDYISPEQARHPRSVDTRSDLYSLGCTLYHMITGRVPFAAASLPEKLYAHQLQNPDPPSSLVPGVPPALDAIVMRLMAKSPDDRFPNPQALAEALAPFAQGAAAVAAILRPHEERDEERGPAPSQVAPGPPDDGSDPNGFQLGPEHEYANLPPTRTASAMRPEPRTEASAVADPPRSDSDPGVGGGPPATEPEPEPEPGPRRPAGPGGLGLPIDLGPEPSLVEALGSSRSRSRSSVSKADSGSNSAERARLSAPTAPPPPGWSGRHRRAALVAAAVALALGLGTVLSRFVGPGGGASAVPSGGETGDGPAADAPAESGAAPAFSVGRADGSGLIGAGSFQDALSLAPNNGGTVYLADGGGPFRVDAGTPAFVAPRSPIVIRPRPGGRATITVELGGREPWLRQTEGSLTLQDLTVLVRHEGPPGDRPPLVEANGPLTLRRCTFSADPAPGGISRAARATSSTTIDGCLFSGFGRPIDLVAYGTLTHEVRNCIFAWTRGDGLRPGWAVRVVARVAGQAGSARLTIQGCSVLGGAGLVDAEALMADRPLEIRVASSAIQADHLLRWSPPVSDASFPSGLRWTGSGNRYAIRQTAWVVSSTEDPGAPEWSPTDRESWVGALGNSGTDDSVQADVRLADASAMQSGSLHAPRFAARSEGEPVGADPSLVGPTPLPPPVPAGE